MTKDNIQTRRMYQHTYFGSIGVAMIELEILDLATEHIGFDDMIEARTLMDEKIPIWK
jgi:hypothetical protein